VEDQDNRHEIEGHGPDASARGNRWLLGMLILLFVATAVSLGYGYHQHSTANQLAAEDQQLSASVSQMRAQLETLSARLADLSATVANSQQAPPSPQTAAKGKAAGPHSAAANRRGPGDSRLKQMQTQLDDQKKQLAETRDEVAKSRADLEGNISSTRDELNGSIARTHEELVALAKRSERNFFEFDLVKSKSFQRTGPVELSLRKADTKHKSYNLQMLVDDDTLSKKNVNLYEPVWIHRSDDPQPVQIVVNRIEKDRVHGYVSAPKYKQSELASNAAPGTIGPVVAAPNSQLPSSTQPGSTPH
jgi:cell division protein FtsB